MNIATPAESTQLVTIPTDVALFVYTTDKAIDSFLASIRKELDAFVPDISTVTGRKAIASMAYKVAQSKTYLEGVGKALADEQKEIPKKIDACRKTVRDTLDKWRDEVRKPLTDWENAEDARVKRHTDFITVLNDISRNAPGRDSTGLRESLAFVEAVAIGPSCEEFEADYARAKDAARASLNDEIPRAEKRETEAAELIRLREESAKRAEADRIVAIQREAAEKATRDAEAAAKQKLDDAAARESAVTAAAAEAARQAEIAAQRKIDEANEAAAAAQRREADTAARLQREADEKKQAEELESARREANKRHCGAINRKAVAAFVEGGMTEKAAMQAVTLIAQKAIPAITILY